jgi:hypothetical protein
MYWMAATVQWKILSAMGRYPEQLFISTQTTLTNEAIIRKKMASGNDHSYMGTMVCSMEASEQ